MPVAASACPQCATHGECDERRGGEQCLAGPVPAVRRSGLVRGQEAAFRTRSGAEIPVELAASALREDSGRPGMLIVLRDGRRPGGHVAGGGQPPAESAHPLAPAKAEPGEAERARFELLSFAAHEIRGPLGNIRAAADRMVAGCDAINPACQRMFGLIDGQLGQANELVRSVLCAANIEAGKLVLHREPMPVLAAVQEAVRAMQAVADSRPVRLAVPPDLPPVDIDRERIVAVLRNLLGNADKYTPRGAGIVVTAEAGTGGVTLRVRDHGAGLSEADLERAFDKCHRGTAVRRVDGYGLGLYICREVVAAHGGRIWAENHPGGGAVFSFTLPIAQ